MAFFYLLAFFCTSRLRNTRCDNTVRRLYLSGAIMSCLLSLWLEGNSGDVSARACCSGMCSYVGSEARCSACDAPPRHLPFWLVLVLAAGWAWSHPRYSELAQFSFTIRPLWDNVLSELHAMAYALLLFFVPGSRTSITIFRSSIRCSSGRFLLISCCSCGTMASTAWSCARRSHSSHSASGGFSFSSCRQVSSHVAIS